MKGFLSLVAGFLFGLGLALSGMTRPAKVIGFLDFFGSWDPTLAFVMAGALGAYALAYRWVMRRFQPLFEPVFYIPEKKRPDAPLLIGAALFGVGWGLGGFCPGPAVVSLASGAGEPFLFGAAMLAGMALRRWALPPDPDDDACG